VAARADAVGKPTEVAIPAAAAAPAIATDRVLLKRMFLLSLELNMSDYDQTGSQQD